MNNKTISTLPQSAAADDPSRFDWLIEHYPPFRQLPKAAQEHIAAGARLRIYQAGEIIYLEGEPATHAFVLVKGWIKATRMTAEGREQGLIFMDPIDMFGEVAVLAGSTYPATVTALEPVKVWAVAAETILSMVRLSPESAEMIIRTLSNRVLHYISLVESLSMKSVDVRLAHTLLQHAQVEDGRLIVPRGAWTTYDAMAVRLGTVRDVLSRALKALENEGCIEVHRHKIVILDPQKLSSRGSDN